MNVKICGTTNLEDALMAAEAGADYLGFIFYPPSKRGIEVAAARPIIQQLRARPNCPMLVGVFVNETAESMAQILDECQLDLAQLHGDEPPWLIGDERSPLYGRAFKALRPTSLAEAQAEAEWYISPISQSPNLQSPISNYPLTQLPTFLLDTYHPTLPGGTGQKMDWTIAASLAQQYSGLMLAGGLTADNVAEAVRWVRPYAVDVASGVEASPGKKEPNLVRAFIQNAQLAG
jgi:phosphoribosylanthranilate isomerase